MAGLLSIRKLIIRLYFGVIFLLILGIRGYAQTVDFTYDNPDCGNSIINFHGTMGYLNANNYDFYWEFGDGKTANVQDVSHDFLISPGQTQATFSVKLTARDLTTNIATSIQKDITIRPAPIPVLVDASFPTDPFNNCSNSPTPQIPDFTIIVKNGSSNTDFISTYLIDWGDGSSTETYSKNLFPSTRTHHYTTLGLFRLRLTVTGDNGCSVTKEYKVKNQSNPGVGISTSGNTEGCWPVSFSFKLNGIKYNDPETTYLFEFGDGTTQTWTHADAVSPLNDTIIKHIYNTSSCDQPGKAFTVKVTASNSCSSTPATVGGIKVTSKPLPDFSASNLCADEYVQFNNFTQSDCSNKVSYTWDFGDGSPTVTTTDVIAIPHKFPTGSDVIHITLTVHSSCQDQSITKDFTLTKTPHASFILNPTDGCLNLTTPLLVNATNNSTGVFQNSLWTVSPSTGWTFSQGGPNTTNAQFYFTKKNNYYISLTVSNSCKSDTHQTRIMINDLVNATLVSSITSSTCDSYTFDASDANIFKIDSIQYENVSAKWDIIPATGWAYISSTTETSIAPKIAFNAPGTYTISVKLTNGCGTITRTTTLFIKETARVNSSPSATTGCAPKQIDFTDQSTGTNLRHLWTVSPASGYSFVNSVANSKEVSIRFNSAGIYTVTHRVTGDCNQVSQSFTIAISAAPIITFQSIGNKCDLPPYNLIIDANNFKLNNNGVPLSSIKWSVSPSADVTYIDGTTETSTYPHFQFNKTGQYTVNVEVVNDCGTSNASQVFRILEHAAENATPSTTNGCRPLSVSFTDHSNGDLLVHNWSVSPVTDWTMSGSATAPSFAFTKTGIYTVTHKVSNQCGSDQHDYIITVKDKPSATLAPFQNQCDSYIFYADQQNFNVTLNQNAPNEVNYLWTVTPASSLVNFTNSTNKNSQYPTIQISDTGVFVIKAAISSACGDTAVEQTIHITTSPQIALTQSLNTHCLPADLTFTGKVFGQSLTYQWSVLPNNGNSFQNGTSASSPRPLIRFTQPGPYEVTLKVSNKCGDAIQHWNDTIIGKPTINLTSIPDTCDNYTLKTEKFVTFQDNGNAITGFNWTITPNSGFDYIDGTTKTSEYPHILFRDAATYQLTIEATNYCGVSLPFSRSFTVDNFVQVTVGKDSTFCTNTNLIQLTGIPPGGNWSILPSTASSLIKIIGYISYFDPSVPGTYTLTYHRGNTYCFSEAIRKFTVVALPVVDAGRDFSICSNETKPYTLTGTPVGGTWTGSGVTGNTFSANGLAVGSYILKYSYTDPNTQCLNTDQLVARVLDVPVTGFNAPQGCKDKPLTFTPFGTPNTKYTWDFGDGQTGSSTGPINHTYHLGGIYTVSLQSSDPNNCALSSSKTIKIQEEKATPSDTVGCAPLAVSFTDQSTGDLLSHNWTVSPAGSNTYSPSATVPSPTITFSKAGIYKVTHTTSTTCGSDQHSYSIRVKDTATATLSTFPNSCNSFTFTANPQNYIVTPNQNDAISYLWTVTPVSPLVSFINNTSKTSQYPTIQISDTGVFVIKAMITGDCGTTETHQTVRITKKPEIALKQNLNKRCIPSDLTFTGTVYGQDLVYQWSVLPDNGIVYQNNTSASSPRPRIRFTQPGIYTVSLNVSNKCDATTQQWNDTIVSEPTIAFAAIPDTCDNYTFKAEHFVKVQDNGAPITGFNWSIVPNSGFVFTDGTNNTNEYPHILFTNAGTYAVTFNATNECGGTTISHSFIADKFIQVTVGRDSTFCTNSDLIQLAGNPVGGIWSILPASASGLLKMNGNINYFDPSVPGSYTLTYHRGNSYCYSEASKKYTVVALPIVDAGRDFSICINEKKPYELNGTPAGGIWTGSGITGNTFSTNGLSVGNYILKYTYTDPNTSCLNSDQLVARVLDVPVTGFNVQIQGCKDQPITFTPFGPANTVFNWDFGDGQTGSSTGPINHIYRKGDTFIVSLTSADPNNCAYNSSKNIFIQGDIIMPVVSYTPANGCGPLTVTFTIDTTGTTGNGQKHQWDFGNGIVVNDAITGKVITYNPGLADTSYTVHLTVSNNCFTKTVDYTIPVRSKPNTDFSFPRPWVCSPATVHIKNQTIDRSASFHWDFDDGTTSTEYEPTHIFTTGKIAREFKVKLVASNGCGKDSVTKTLLVKPNSMEAFIEMSALQACPRDLVTFRNLSTDTVSKITSVYWDFGDGTIVNTWDATHAYVNSGKYTVKLFIDNGCSQAQTTEQIEILKVPDLLISSLDTICKGDTLKLEGSSSGVVLVNGKWDFGDGSSGTGTKITHVYSTLGWHTITFTAADGTSILKCAGLKTKMVYVKDTPPQLFLPDLAGCSPFSISIPSPGSDAYLWNFGDDNLWIASGKHTYINNGSQPVRRKVTVLAENNLLCRTTSFFWVTVYPNPVAKIGVRSEEGYPETVYFKNLSTNSTNCEWSFPDGSIGQSCDSIAFRFYRNGSSRIYLKVTNQYGCTDTTSIIHQTLIKGLYVPNAMQPSNSDPLVKIFKPAGIGLRTYHLGIYDIWGNLIWETETLKDTETVEGWDGKTKSGKDLPQGVYIWRISAIFIDGTSWKGMKSADKKERTEGTITLIR